jgi:hypothetical protein
VITIFIYKIDDDILRLQTAIDQPDEPELYVYQLTPFEWLTIGDMLAAIVSGVNVTLDTAEKVVATQIIAVGTDNVQAFTPDNGAYMTLAFSNDDDRFEQLVTTANQLQQQNRLAAEQERT